MPAPLLAGISMAAPAAAGAGAGAGASFLGPLLAAIGAGGMKAAGGTGFGLMNLMNKNKGQNEQDPYSAFTGMGAGGFPSNVGQTYFAPPQQIQYAPPPNPMANFYRNLGRGQ